MIFDINNGSTKMLEMEIPPEEMEALAKRSRQKQSSTTRTSSNFYSMARLGKSVCYLMIGLAIGVGITSDMASSLRYWESGGQTTLAPTNPPTPHPPTPQPIQITRAPTVKIDDSEDWSAHAYAPIPSTVLPDPQLTPERATELEKEWGKWNDIVDDVKRPNNEEYCSAHPNRDIPRDKFPKNAWQTDPVYLAKWLDEGLKLVDRGQEAILTEYGLGIKDMPSVPFANRSSTFHLALLDDLNTQGKLPNGMNFPGDGGFIEKGSFPGLVRRLLHALMTQDTFTFVTGGHSAAAGHGNLFRQSYTMQFHKVMEPILGLLGVTLQTKNFAQGGMGTLQSSLGMRDIYGDEIDMLIWDSGMTENDAFSQEIYMRQAMISGKRVPFIFGGKWDWLHFAWKEGFADVGQFGTGMVDIPDTTDEVHAQVLPYAVRFLKCVAGNGAICNDNKYRANCWVNRSDVIPPTPQVENPGGQVVWHPGFRQHQITGRTIAFTVLRALKEALLKWKQAENYALPDKEWHVTAHYEKTQTKMRNVDQMFDCEAIFKNISSTRICNLALHARTEYTPRANPEKTSIQSLIKPNELGYIPHIIHKMLYTGPDVHNPYLDLPERATDVCAIVSNGRTYNSEMQRRQRRLQQQDPIAPGLGWIMSDGLGKNGYCDGTYNSECGRKAHSRCLLSGHNDGRAGIMFDSYSGWLVMTLPQLQEGVIMTKIETWYGAGSNPMTKNWTSIDNKGLRQNLRANNLTNRSPFFMSSEGNETSDRRLWRKKALPPETCDNFQFQFAVDGIVTTWNKTDWLKQNHFFQQTVELQILLDDPKFTSEPKDVELAIRMTGCGDTSKKTMSLTHIYFA